MLDKQTRGAILVLRRKGHSQRLISQLLSLNRQTVKKIIKIGSDAPPVIHRPGKLDGYHKRIAQMLAEFDGSVVKVRRALADAGTSVGYSTLTAFCRKHHLLDRVCRPPHSVEVNDNGCSSWHTEHMPENAIRASFLVLLISNSCFPN